MKKLRRFAKTIAFVGFVLMVLWGISSCKFGNEPKGQKNGTNSSISSAFGGSTGGGTGGTAPSPAPSKTDYTGKTEYDITAANGRIPRSNKKLAAAQEEVIKKMVSNAAEKIIDFYPLTFKHLKGKGLGIGLVDSDSPGSLEGASVRVNTTSHSHPQSEKYGKAELEMTLNVNTVSLGSHNSKNALASTISHEIMHAMMFESLTAGMLGRGADLEGRPMIFPFWFIEGTAVIVGGGKKFVNRILYSAPSIDRENGGTNFPTNQELRITDSELTEDYVKKALTVFRLKAGRLSNIHDDKTTIAVYGVGYLACAYLGQLIENNGTPNYVIDVTKIRRGLDLFMAEIAKGYSMDDAIKRLTRGKYENTDKFEDESLDDLAKYSYKFIQEIKHGFGSTLTDLGSNDMATVVNQNMPAQPSMLLNPDYTRMKNSYSPWTVVFKGGGEKVRGYAFNGQYPKGAQPPYPPLLRDILLKPAETE